MLRLELNIDIDGDARASAEDGGLRVSGTVVGPDGSQAAFVGWVGLLALVQRALSASGTPTRAS